IFIESLEIPHRQRPGTYKTHITHKDVEELRQLINTRATQKSPRSCDARIIFYFEDGTVHLILLLKLVHQFFRARNHCAEFIDPESPFVHSDSLLPKEHFSLG